MSDQPRPEDDPDYDPDLDEPETEEDEEQAQEGRTHNARTMPRIDELTMLKQRAAMMGIKHSNNINVETLRARIQAKMEAQAPEQPEPPRPNPMPKPSNPVPEPDPNEPAGPREPQDAAQAIRVTRSAMTPYQQNQQQAMDLRAELVRKYMKLVRVRIQNLDPKKKDLRGEIFTIANETIGTVSKFVPYGEVTDGGYHLPYCIYKMLDRRRFVNITVVRDPRNGRETVRTSLAKEFAFEVLPDLTRTQLQQLAIAQAAAGSIGASE